MRGRIIVNKFKTDVTSVKVGLASTFSDKGIFKSTDTTAEQIKSNLTDVLMTNPGERFFDPTYGCGLKRLLFEQQGDLSEKVEDLVSNQIQTHIPLIDILDITVDNSYEEYAIIITIKYKIRHTSSTDELNIGINA